MGLMDKVKAQAAAAGIQAPARVYATEAQVRLARAAARSVCCGSVLGNLPGVCETGWLLRTCLLLCCRSCWC